MQERRKPMGKPYNHSFIFSGSGGSTGTMICEVCNQPIFDHNQDWMSYAKSKSHDWAYHCFHRKCVKDQTGWEKIEKQNEKSAKTAEYSRDKFRALAKELNLTFDMDLVNASADAVGIDLDQLFFDAYGSS